MGKSGPLYRYLDASGDFVADAPAFASGLYFPLCNEEGLLSSITPTLHGDIKIDQHSFLTPPVTSEDLPLTRSSRNFWVRTGSGRPWSVTGQSVWQKALKPEDESVQLEAGFLWQRVTRKNKSLGLTASVLSFVPADGGTFEVMRVEVINNSKKALTLQAVSAVPFYGRSADNLRDHRHVTSLLHRLWKDPFGLKLCPTMAFNERGHLHNHTVYYVLGADQDGRPPVGFFPTQRGFTGETGDLERPDAVFHAHKPQTSIQDQDHGKEAMGALQFRNRRLKPGASAVFVLFLGVDPTGKKTFEWVPRLSRPEVLQALWEKNRAHWQKQVSRVQFETGDTNFNRWIKWVQLQPTLRKIFGNSFLPDFDYGRGGRGWRDLWQDCLALMLADPDQVRDMIRGNFAGVRIDGSNATIIGKKPPGSSASTTPEFIADRNNITRTWMDHGSWPFLTTQLYLHQTGDFDLLLEPVPYFRDAQLNRARKRDAAWNDAPSHSASHKDGACALKTADGTPYKGTIVEHMLVQTLVQFFNVGDHNAMRLEDADWNDGLDMAFKRGESVAFTHLYGSNLASLADMLEAGSQKKGWSTVVLAKEIFLLLDRIGDSPVNYDQPEEKTRRLEAYFDAVPGIISGETVEANITDVARDLRAKAEWIRKRLNDQEWVEMAGHRWFNGYYDNEGRQVEGASPDGRVLMTLTGQVFAIMGRTADETGVKDLVAAVRKNLFDERLQGYRLNTNFGAPQPALGRAFSFAFGEKENGAVFSHMVVMLANALYQRGFSEEGAHALFSLYRMAVRSERSKIFPGLPEYFDNEGRGRYHYLTGSASWFVLTLLTQVYGFRGFYGSLLIAPKLSPEHFDKKGEARVTAPFGGALVTLIVRKGKKAPHGDIRSLTVTDENDVPVPLLEPHAEGVLIPRGFFRGKKDQTIIATFS